MMFNKRRPSPPQNWINAACSTSLTCLSMSAWSTAIACSAIWINWSLSKAFNTYTWHLDNKALLTSKPGFSVVAPMSKILPDSTAPNKASCWLLLKRWISSKNNKILPCSLASCMIFLTSATPALIALNCTKGNCKDSPIILARVVLPTPGGPQNNILGICPDVIYFLKGASGPVKCSWPKNSLKFLGRTRSAKGTICMKQR